MRLDRGLGGLAILARDRVAAACLCFAVLAAATARGQEPSPETFPDADVSFFQDDIRPILETHCFKCHGGEGAPKAGLRLTSRAGILRGGDSGPAVSLDAPAESLLLSAVNYEAYEMPPSGKLPDEQRAALARWVELGLPWTPGDEAEEVYEPVHAGPPAVNDETRAHWAFRPVERPEDPLIERDGWAAGPIDAFILARLDAAGLHPAPPADKAALVRRAYYDLTGLPPSPEEVAAFVQDDSAEAWPKLVDRLLDSPHYGEKWARHWLDLVRYAETNSYERDGAKPYVWRYRDYVIRSFNEDKPYDRFLIEQLAGDELPDRSAEALIATGYYRLGIWDDEPSDPEQAHYDDLDDILSTTSQVFLGLTVGCARCHDHKLDPLPQADYYRMLAFFSGVQRFGVRSYESVEAQSLRPIGPPGETAARAAEVAAHAGRVDDNRGRMEAIEAVVREDFIPVEREEFVNEGRQLVLLRARVPRLLSEEQFAAYERLFREREELRQFRPRALEQALCVTETGPTPRETFLLIRGNPHSPGDAVEPGFPRVLPVIDVPVETAPPEANSSGRRTALAKWMASPQNPLTTRVLVNRVWQYHFGRGIVRSASNFGLTADAPTHPELLDWLAAEFVSGGWKLKSLHRQIMLSNAYRMSSEANPVALAQDPQNDLLWRFDPRRLTAEEVRDSILAVNGSLNRDALYGPSIFVPIPAEVLAGQSMPGSGWGESTPEDRRRRSIYIHVKRSLSPPILTSFDAPETDFSCPVRFATTQPTQALGMLNGSFLHEEAQVFADYLRATADDDPAEQVRLCLRRTLQREATEVEVRRGLDFLAAAQGDHGLTPERALKYFCLVALNLNEFVYLD